MKNVYLILLTSLISLLSGFTLCAQVSSPSNEDFQILIKKLKRNDVKVSLSSDVVNNRHPYVDFFREQDNDYLQWLYVTNSVNMMTNNAEDYYGERRILNRSGGNNTLIFKVENEQQVQYDTLRNSVHPNLEDQDQKEEWDVFGIRKSIAKWRGLNTLKDRNIRGDLPRCCMAYIESRRSRKITVGVNVVSSKSEVDIQVLNKKNEVVDILVDKSLLKGWSDYEWVRGTNPRGKYTVKITIDGQSLLQDIKI